MPDHYAAVCQPGPLLSLTLAGIWRLRAGYLGMRWAYAYAGITSPRAYSDAGVYQYTPLSKDDKQASARPLQTSIAGSAHPSNDFSCGSLAKQDHIELAVADGTTQAVVLGKLG